MNKMFIEWIKCLSHGIVMVVISNNNIYIYILFSDNFIKLYYFLHSNSHDRMIKIKAKNKCHQMWNTDIY